MDLYHVLSRGVEKRKIVMDDRDRARFIHDLFVMNDANIVRHISQTGRETNDFSQQRKLLVNIHAFCLMGNHYHLLLSNVIDGGISKFIQKLNMGYTKYFNDRHRRSGALWQGKHKKILVKRDAYFMYIPYYIHLNPLDYSFPEWRAGKVKNAEKALGYLRTYRWSSHLDYLGEKNFPSVTYRTLLSGTLSDAKHCEREIANIITRAPTTIHSDSIEH